MDKNSASALLNPFYIFSKIAHTYKNQQAYFDNGIVITKGLMIMKLHGVPPFGPNKPSVFIEFRPA